MLKYYLLLFKREGAFIGSNEKTTGVAISPDGTKIFVAKFGDATDISLYQYTLDTAFDISSKTLEVKLEPSLVMRLTRRQKIFLIMMEQNFCNK